MIKATFGDYVAACGNSLPAGALLKHMEYLCAHSSIVVDEHKWYIKSRDDMMLEVGLSSYRRILVTSGVRRQRFEHLA